MIPPIFPNLDCLLDLTRHDGVDIRPTLLRVLTDLYVQRPSHPLHEERHFTELAMRLLDVVDTPTRTAVARRLATYAAPPRRIIERLARDVPEVASMLRDLAKTSAPENGHAASVSPEANDSREDIFDEEPLRAAADQSTRDSQRVPVPALARTAPSPDELDDLFFTATPAERRLILSNLACAAAPSPAPIRASRANDAVRRLEMAALQNRPGEFVRELEQVLEISHEKAQRIVADAHGEALLAAAKALAMPVEILQRILLFVNPAIGHSVDRVYDLSSFYERIEPAAALRLVAIWRELDSGERRAHTYRSLFRPPETQADRRASIDRSEREAERGRPSSGRRQRTI